MRSIESSFQFVSYKIDDIKLTAIPNIANLEFPGPLGADQVQLQVGVNNPQAAEDRRHFVIGIRSRTVLFRESTAKPESRMAELVIGLSGVFISNEDLDDATKDKLVKLQAPAILFAYMRSAITSILSAAGYGGVILPLVNMSAVAENAKLEVVPLGTTASWS